jgi:DNA mismatch repair protein MutS
VEATTETNRLDPAAGEFRSILFIEETDPEGVREPPFFADLNLDQLIAAILGGRDEYELKPFFHTPLRDVRAVEYRHEVFRDLEQDDVRGAVCAFGGAMRRTRQYLTLAGKQRFQYEKERWFLDAAAVYCGSVLELRNALGELELGSQGLRALRSHLLAYANSEDFTSASSDLRRVRDGLARVRYSLRIKGARVTVSAYRDERDYSIQVEETFARFRQGAVEDHLVELPDSGSMDHVEARIAQLVARLYPQEFRALAEFCTHHSDFVDPLMARFDREVQAYLAYLEFTDQLAANDLPFCYPSVSAHSKDVSAQEGFDLALAAKLASEGRTVVYNTFALQGSERILVVTGPNQGGKTTFARMFGQLHYLAALGVPVPARSAQLFLADRLFTHFEKEEDISTLRGKLDDELVRLREILERTTSDSVVILNEIFSSTTLADAVDLGALVLKRVVELGCLAVCVTFVDELASLGEATVSMVATVARDDPSVRTFEIVRRPADGRAYAWALGEKYGLSYERLRSRIGR